MIRSALMVALTATTVAAQGFEGGITMKMTSGNGQDREMTYLVKGGKIRVDVPGGMGAVILDGGTKKMQMMMTAQKMYVEMDMSDAAAATSKAPPKVSRTGKMETIAGYQCEHVIITDDAGTATDVCMASGLGGFMMPGGGRGGPPGQEAWVKALGEASFPLKVQQNGKVSLEVTKVEKKSLDASLFSVPDGFTKMDMPMGRRGGG